MHILQQAGIDVLISLISGIGISALVAIFAKKLPKEETFKKRLAPIAEWCAVTIHKFFGKYLTPIAEKKLEEGVFLTLAYWLDGWIHVFIAKLNDLIYERINQK